jgi:hypothetical protein
MLRKDLKKASPIASGTADPLEIARFDVLAEEWWKPDGAFKVIHDAAERNVAAAERHAQTVGARSATSPIGAENPAWCASSLDRTLSRYKVPAWSENSLPRARKFSAPGARLLRRVDREFVRKTMKPLLEWRPGIAKRRPNRKIPCGFPCAREFANRPRAGQPAGQ